MSTLRHKPKRPNRAAHPALRRGESSIAIALADLPDRQPAFVEPMKALLCDELPRGSNWAYEIKFDGVRALAIKNGSDIQLLSRTEKDLGDKYDAIVEVLQRLPSTKCVLDGEVVAVDETGRSSFQLLQSYHSSPKKPSLFYYVFDALNVEGKDITGLTLSKRKELTQHMLSAMPSQIRFSADIDASTAMIAEMKRHGFEGLIAKKLDSLYEIGRRSGAWVKYKWATEQEFVIGGYTPPQGARSHFGALLVGYYDKGKLLFAAKVGTGFGEKTLSTLIARFQKLIVPECPFANLPERLPGAYGQGMTAGKMRQCTWLRPELVCQVRFAEWTRDHHLRQPAFLGLREDKHPQDVVRETPG